MKIFDIDTKEEKILIEKFQPVFVTKAWGYEKIIYNGDEYCGKVLHFEPHKRFSLHYHVKKQESWYVSWGSFKLTMIDPETAEYKYLELASGDCITIYPGYAHRLEAGEHGGAIFEVSTTHQDSDSYRIIKSS